MPWSVRNHLSASGLPVEDWAAAARRRFDEEPDVVRATVTGARGLGEVDGVETAALDVDVVLEAANEDLAAELVKALLLAGLADVIGDRPAGWMSGPWYATRAERDPGEELRRLRDAVAAGRTTIDVVSGTFERLTYLLPAPNREEAAALRALVNEIEAIRFTARDPLARAGEVLARAQPLFDGA